MKKECEIARDLMPLVIDEVASAGSKETVTAHVAVCPDCAAYLAQLKAAIPAPTTEEKEDELEALHAAAAKLRRKKWLRALCWAALGVLAACVAILGGSSLSNATIPLETDAYRLFLSQMQNGNVVVNADYQGTTEELVSFGVRLIPETDQATGEQASVYYVRVERYLFSRRGEAPMQNGPAWFFTPTDLNACVEIRQGKPGRYTVLWKQGDAIPAASAEMEAYFARLDQTIHPFDERMPETEDGDAADADPDGQEEPFPPYSQLKFLQSQVPEWQPWVEGAVDMLNVGILRWLTEEIAKPLTD